MGSPLERTLVGAKAVGGGLGSSPTARGPGAPSAVGRLSP